MTDRYSQMSPFLRAIDRTTAPPDDGSAPVDHVIAAGIPGGYDAMNRAVSGIRGMAKTAYNDYEGMGGLRGMARSVLGELGYSPGPVDHTGKGVPAKIPHYDPQTGKTTLIKDSPLPLPPEPYDPQGGRNIVLPSMVSPEFGGTRDEGLNVTDVPKNIPPLGYGAVRGANGGRMGYAMGGSPFEQLGDDAPGQPVEDVADILQFIRKQNDQFGGSEGTRTYYGGAPARLGTPEGNAFYEKQNNLTPGTLKPSNFGRGKVLWSGLTDAEKARYMQLYPDQFGGSVGEYAFGGSPFGAHPFNVERAASIGLQREGFLNSGVAGRTDHIGLQVRNGSYVIPADVVSAAGQGNSLAGAKAFDSLLKQGPYGTSVNPIRNSRPMMPSMRMGNTMRMSNNMGRMNTSGFGSQKSTGIPGFMADGGTVKKPRELVAPKEGSWKGLSAGGVSHPGADHSIPILAAGGEYVVAPEVVARIGGGDQQKGFRILDKLVLLTRKKHIDTLRKLKPPKKK